MKNFILRIVPIFFVLSTNVLSAEIDTILHDAIIGDKLITSFKCDLTYEAIHIDSTFAGVKIISDSGNSGSNRKKIMANSHKVDIEYFFDGIKKKFITKQNMPNPRGDGSYVFLEENIIYNGERTDTMRITIPPGKSAIPRGYISNGRIINPRHDPFYWGSTIFGTAITSFLQNVEICPFSWTPINQSEIQLLNDEMVDGISCKKIVREDESNNSVVTVWLSPQHMYRAVKMEYGYLTKKYVVNVSYFNNDDGFFVPQKIVIHTYNIDDGISKYSNKEIIIVNENYEINTSFPIDTFSMKFMKGVKVFDHRTGEMNEAN